MNVTPGRSNSARVTTSHWVCSTVYFCILDHSHLRLSIRQKVLNFSERVRRVDRHKRGTQAQTGDVEENRLG